jgi:hypothetical protein
VAGLIVYMGLERRSAEKLIDDVAAAIFYAMASLAICAFLYAGISGDPEGSRRGATLMVWYAVVLSLSVLALFYSLTLMIYERESTRPMPRSLS